MERECSGCACRKPVEEFYASGGRCRVCRIAATKLWIEKNRDRALENSRRWKEQNADHLKAYHRARDAKRALIPRVRYRGMFVGPPDLRFKLKREEMFAGPPKPSFDELFGQYWFWFLVSCIALAHVRRVLRRGYERKWLARHPEAKKRKKANGKGHRRKSKVLVLFKRQRERCAGCREKLKAFDVDHIIPRASGGGNEVTNLQLLCKDCNNSKAARHPVEFMQERGFLL